MSEILATWVLDTAKKKKYTSPASSRRSSMEGFFAPQDDADDITDLSLGPDKFYGGDKAEDKRNATTLTSNEPSNAETALLVANVDLDRLRRQYSSLRAELRNRPNEGQKRQNDCFKLIGWMTAQMTKMTEIKTQNQLDEAEVSSHIQELQGMKDQLNLLAGTQDSEKPRKTDNPRGFSHIGSWTSS
jgi:hypothetical protein